MAGQTGSYPFNVIDDMSLYRNTIFLLLLLCFAFPQELLAQVKDKSSAAQKSHVLVFKHKRKNRVRFMTSGKIKYYVIGENKERRGYLSKITDSTLVIDTTSYRIDQLAYIAGYTNRHPLERVAGCLTSAQFSGMVVTGAVVIVVGVATAILAPVEAGVGLLVAFGGGIYAALGGAGMYYVGIPLLFGWQKFDLVTQWTPEIK